MRYGVLFDVGDAVFRGNKIDVSTGYANVIWQGEANSRILRCLRHCTAPVSPINITGPALAVRDVAAAFGKLFSKEPVFAGVEDTKGWLVDASHSDELFGPLQVPVEVMIGWLADWISNGRENLNKPTAFDSRDGSF